MIKRVSLVRRKEGMSREDFLAHWMGPHAEIVRHLPGLRGLGCEACGAQPCRYRNSKLAATRPEGSAKCSK